MATVSVMCLSMLDSLIKPHNPINSLYNTNITVFQYSILITQPDFKDSFVVRPVYPNY